MVGIFVVAIVATPFVFAGWLIHRILTHRAQMRQEALPPAPRALPPDPELEQRVRNLEAIVTSLDYDLAARLRASDPRAA
jgi:hypothetical protein